MIKEDLDFEISLYEKLVEENPNFVNALIALGDAYTKKGCYEDGLRIDKRLAKLRPDDPIIYYNLACSYSLVKNNDFSLWALEEAIRLGYRDFAFIQKDSDLKFVRKDPRYKELLFKYGESGS